MSRGKFSKLDDNGPKCRCRLKLTPYRRLKIDPCHETHHSRCWPIDPGFYTRPRRKDLLKVEEWADIRRLYKSEEMGIKAI